MSKVTHISLRHVAATAFCSDAGADLAHMRTAESLVERTHSNIKEQARSTTGVDCSSID
jgi:hypothetical protein